MKLDTPTLLKGRESFSNRQHKGIDELKEQAEREEVPYLDLGIVTGN